MSVCYRDVSIVCKVPLHSLIRLHLKLKAAKKRSQPKKEWTTRDTGDGREAGACVMYIGGGSWMYYDNVAGRRGQHLIFTFGLLYLFVWLIFLFYGIRTYSLIPLSCTGIPTCHWYWKTFYPFGKCTRILSHSCLSPIDVLCNLWLHQYNFKFGNF